MSAFVVVGRFAPDEERLFLSKPVVQFSFTYGVSRGIFIFLYTSSTSFFIYCYFIRILLFFFQFQIILLVWVFIKLFDTRLRTLLSVLGFGKAENPKHCPINQPV